MQSDDRGVVGCEKKGFEAGERADTCNSTLEGSAVCGVHVSQRGFSQEVMIRVDVFLMC